MGFKLFPEHIRRSEASRKLFSQVLADKTVRKIVLRRENRVAVAVSKLRAATTGTYIHKKLDHVAVVLDPPELQRFIDTYDSYYQYLKKATVGQHVLWMTYEAWLEDPERELAKVCEHVGVALP